MSDNAKWLVMLGVGLVLLWLGIRSLRTRAWHDGVPAIELLIDRVGGVDPPARNAWDRRFSLFQAWSSIVFGTLIAMMGLAFLYSSFASE